MKTLKRVLLLLVLVMVGLLVGKNVIAKAAVTGGAKAITGLDVSIRSMDVGLLKTAIGIKGLEIQNPRNFVDSVMLDMPEIYIHYDLRSFLKGAPHLEEVRLHLEELDVVKNEDGAVNINSIRALQAGPPREEAKGPTKPSKGGMLEFQIDHLNLKVGKVVYKDYSKGAPPQVKEFNVNIDEHYEHITNPYTFAGLVVSRALMKTTVGQLANLDVNALQSGVMNTLRASAGSFLPTVNAFGKEATGTAKGAVGSANQAVQETTDTLKKLFGK